MLFMEHLCGGLTGGDGENKNLSTKIWFLIVFPKLK